MLWIEQNREALGVLVELEAVEGTPLRRDGVSFGLNAFKYPPKAHCLRIEHPGCVARLKNHGIHSSTLALKHKVDVRFAFTFCDDLQSFCCII